MGYRSLTDDVLLEIGSHLDSKSILAWSRTSKRHLNLLHHSKSLWMTIVKSWPVTAFPLSLPVHLTEGSMTTGDIRAAIQRSLALEASIKAARDKKNCYCGSEMIGKRPLSVAEEYPGSMCKNMAYFDGPGLGLFLFDDPNEHRCRFIVLYQISPGRRLAEWDAGEEAEIACWSYTWADLGGPMKQLVVAASLWHPKWVEPTRRPNVLEVRAIDISNTDRAGFIHTTGFNTKSKAYWPDQYRSVVIGGDVCAAMVFGDGQPVVITCMNWRTGETTNTLVDAAGHPSLSHIPDLSPHIRFDSRDSRDSELILIDDWVGIFQICEGGSVRYIMIPTDYQSKTIPSGEDGGLPPFRSNPEGTVAVGCHPPTRSVVMRIDGGAAVYPTCLHGPKQLRVMIQESPWTDVVIGMLTLDFTRFCSDVARDEIRRRAGFHKLEYLHHEMASVTWPPGSFSPTVGRSGWALGCIRDVEENCPCVELYPLPQEAYNTRLGTPSRVCLPPMVRRESINDLLTLEDAAGVVCLEDSDQRFWFVRIRGTNVVKDNGLLVPLEGVVGLHGAE